MGNSGILSFAHMGFMGVGAYASAVLTIPVQMKGMALPDLYPFLQGVAAVAVSGDRGRRARRGGGRGGRLLSADAAVRRRGRHHLLRAAGRALHGDDAIGARSPTGRARCSACRGRPTSRWRRWWRSLALIGALAFKESRTGRLLRASRDDERRGRGAGRQHSGAALARLRAGGAVRRRRRRAVGALHHLLLAESLLPEGNLPHPGDAGDRRRQHGDRRGGRHLHRHRRL